MGLLKFAAAMLLDREMSEARRTVFVLRGALSELEHKYDLRGADLAVTRRNVRALGIQIQDAIREREQAEGWAEEVRETHARMASVLRAVQADLELVPGPTWGGDIFALGLLAKGLRDERD